MVSPGEEIFIKMAPESLLRTERRYWGAKGTRPDYMEVLSKEIIKRVSLRGGSLNE